MKASIRFFDDVQLDVHFLRDASGECAIEKVFPHFLGRPKDPHVSLFMALNGGHWTPHFTAGSGQRDVFRQTLARVSPSSLASLVDPGERLARDALREAVTLLEPMDLAAFEIDEWLIGLPDARVIKRWLRSVHRRSRVFWMNNRTVESFVAHVVRGLAAPTDLEGVQPAGGLVALAVRFHEAREPEVRVVHHIAKRFTLPDAEGQPIRTLSPGWYSAPFEIFRAETIERFERIVPVAKIEKLGGDVERCLSRFPRHEPPREDLDIPDFASQIFGLYAGALFEQVLAVVAEETEARGQR
jgi:hypothetical protein